MDEREKHEAQAEALHEKAGPPSKSSRERTQDGLSRYLMTEAMHARKIAREERENESRAEE